MTPSLRYSTMKVRDIMSSAPVTCSPADTLNRASELMWNRDVGCVPVVDDEQRLVAMLTDRDVCMAAYTQGRPLSELPVSGAMSDGAHTCAPEDTVEKAERLMLEHQVRRLPVVDRERHVVGVLSLNDVARACCAGLRRGRPEVRTDDVVRTLGAVGEPRAPASADATPDAQRAPELPVVAHA
jgi:CBS domain-containing protein